MTALDLSFQYLYAAPGRDAPLAGGAISLSGDRIAEVKPAVSSRGGLLAMPALADAHDHARGFHHIGFGAKDQKFELWRAALYAQPPIDPYLNAALAFGRLAQSGVGSVMHVYSSIRVDRLIDDARAIARAARDVGIRLGFVVPLRDVQTLGYGPDQELLALHDPRDQAFVKETWLYPFPSPERYMELVREVARAIERPTVTVQLGPNSPQACSDGLLEAIGDASARENRRVTTHLLETSIQRKWADASYPGKFIRRLCDMDVISERFTGAHGVWLRPDEVALMAERRAQIAVNLSSNYRLRSGVAPVDSYIKAGMPFSFGVDSFGFDDDDDALRELRIGHWVFSPLDTDAPLTQELLFRGWHQNGFLAVNGRNDYGRLTPGAPADILVLDYEALSYDLIENMIDPLEVVLTRASSRHVKSLYVAGREIVRDGKVTGVDLPAIEREVIAQTRRGAERARALKPVLERSQATLEEFYRAGGHTRAAR
ncbi:amidohydrolase family protein [Bradyrhizobium sp. F1.13.3]|uniref:amidohydrolase family protein n=1 Tax=Bradyrhizobium sp. F1.13.3 TaxID=3156351 RepID=UPI00339A0BD8